jgi:hypothetical protein
MPVLLVRSLSVIIGLLLPIVLIEVCLRLFGPILPGNYETGVWAHADPDVGHVHTPDSQAWVKEPEFTTYLRFDRYGLRGDDLPPHREARRVLALGDSFIEAKQVPEEQSVTELLTAEASERAGESVEWLNGGVFDWGPVHEYLYLNHPGMVLDPDLVVQFIYVGNDIDDCFPRSRSQLRELERPLATVDDEARLQLLPWTPHRQTGGELMLGWLGRHSTAFRAYETGVVDKLRYQPRSRQPVEGHLLEIFDAKESRAESRAWATIDALLSATRDQAEQLGARYALVIVPSKWQIHRADGPSSSPSAGKWMTITGPAGGRTVGSRAWLRRAASRSWTCCPSCGRLLKEEHGCTTGATSTGTRQAMRLPRARLPISWTAKGCCRRPKADE